MKTLLLLLLLLLLLFLIVDGGVKKNMKPKREEAMCQWKSLNRCMGIGREDRSLQTLFVIRITGLVVYCCCSGCVAQSDNDVDDEVGDLEIVNAGVANIWCWSR